MTVKLCECGCGQATPIAKLNDSRYGHVKGQPVRFFKGHNRRSKTAWNRDKFTANDVRHLTDGTSVLTLYYKSDRMECFIDTADYPLVESYHWTAAKHGRTFYAVTTNARNNGQRLQIYLHR